MHRAISFKQAASDAESVQHFASAQEQEQVSLIRGPHSAGFPYAIAPSPLEFPHAERALEFFQIDTPKRLEIEGWAAAGKIRRAIDCLAGLPAHDTVTSDELATVLDRLGHTRDQADRLRKARQENPELFHCPAAHTVRLDALDADAVPPVSPLDST